MDRIRIKGEWRAVFSLDRTHCIGFSPGITLEDANNVIMCMVIANDRRRMR